MCWVSDFLRCFCWVVIFPARKEYESQVNKQSEQLIWEGGGGTAAERDCQAINAARRMKKE